MTLYLSDLKRIIWKANFNFIIKKISKEPYRVAPDALENASQS